MGPVDIGPSCQHRRTIPNAFGPNDCGDSGSARSWHAGGDMTTTSPPSPGLRMPAEWGPHEGTIMCWPARDALWGDHRRRAVDDYTAIADAIARFEPVTMVAPPRLAEEAAGRCGPGVSVVEIPIDDSWARDSGPLYALDGAGSRVVVDPTFNGWGRKFEPFADDALLARRWAERRGEPVVHDDHGAGGRLGRRRRRGHACSPPSSACCTPTATRT